MKTKRKQYLLWSSSFIPRIGGLENATKEYALYFRKKGWNVHVITNKYPRNLSEQEYMDGIKIVRYSFFHSPLNYLRNQRLDLFFTWIIMKPLTLLRLIIYFMRTRPDIVNLHFPDQQLFECLLMKYIFNFKLIISLHGNEVERMNTLTKNNLRYYYYNDLFNSALLITACSNYLFNQFQNIFPQKKKKKCLTIYNGVGKSYQMQLLGTIKNDNIFTAARFVPKKGLDLLLDAFQNYNTMRLLIGGADENQLNKLGMRLEGDIVILGELSSVDIANHLAISKLTVIPSKKEPYGIIVAEALSCGSPIVATNVGGIPEVLAIAKEKLTQTEIKVFNCWVKLVEPNAKSIEFGIDSILQNSGSIEDYLALVPKFRNQFIWEKRLQDYLKILTKL